MGVVDASSGIGIPSYKNSTPVGAISESRHIIPLITAHHLITRITVQTIAKTTAQTAALRITIHAKCHTHTPLTANQQFFLQTPAFYLDNLNNLSV